MKKLIIISLLLLMVSCGIPSDELMGRIPTDIKNSCEVIGGKYSEKTNCCYIQELNHIIKECDRKILQEKEFIYINFNLKKGKENEKP